jgi:hypothetical protein
MIDKEKMKPGDLVLVQNNGLVTIAKYLSSAGEEWSIITHIFIVYRPERYKHVTASGSKVQYSDKYLTKLIDYNSLKYLI